MKFSLILGAVLFQEIKRELTYTIRQALLELASITHDGKTQLFRRNQNLKDFKQNIGKLSSSHWQEIFVQLLLSP